MKDQSRLRKTPILVLLSLAQLMLVLDFSIVNVSLPSIQRQFGLAPADLFNRKRLFLLGLALFVLASLTGGLAPSLPIILVARAVQGLSAAIVSPTALARCQPRYV